MGAVKALLTTGVVYLRSLAAGGGSGSYTPGGRLTANGTQVGTDADLTEKNLWTYSLPANTLNTDLQAVRITAWGTMGANANSKTFKVYFGATVVVALTTTANGSGWYATAVVIRTAAATQQAGGTLNIGLGNTQSTASAPAETLSGAVTIKVTGQNGSAVANDCLFRGATVELLP